MGVIQVELDVGTITKSSWFMVINSKANFNLLLGREWIHVIGAILSTLHQRISIWKKDGIVENIEADQSYYKVDEVKGGKKSFDQHLENMAPCDDENYTPNENSKGFLSLDPDRGFRWDPDETIASRESIPPT